MEDFEVGPGIDHAMTEDGTAPTTDEIFRPGNNGEVQWSEAIGANGTVYRWIKATNEVHRFPAS